MATAKAKKKASNVAVNLPECSVCMETMSTAMFQCSYGHSLCNRCNINTLLVPTCPMCGQRMTQSEDIKIEDGAVKQKKVPCPNKSRGCIYTKVYADIEDHLKECIFRELACPLGAAFRNCSWRGKYINIMKHFKEHHTENCVDKSNAYIVLNNINIKNDHHHLFLVSQGRMLFTIIFIVNTLQKMAYWVVQHIGSKATAEKHFYEIQVTSNQDERRIAAYADNCLNDAINADEVFRMGRSAVFSLDFLSHFIKDKKLKFRIFMEKLPEETNDKEEKHDKIMENEPNLKYSNEPRLDEKKENKPTLQWPEDPRRKWSKRPIALEALLPNGPKQK